MKAKNGLFSLRDWNKIWGCQIHKFCAAAPNLLKAYSENQGNYVEWLFVGSFPINIENICCYPLIMNKHSTFFLNWLFRGCVFSEPPCRCTLHFCKIQIAISIVSTCQSHSFTLNIWKLIPKTATFITVYLLAVCNQELVVDRYKLYVIAWAE